MQDQFEAREALQRAKFSLGTIETLVPASTEVFDQAAFERTPYIMLRAIYETLRDQQAALESLLAAGESQKPENP